MRWLLYLYPRAWRRRYGAEFGALLERQRPSPGLVLDVVRGALDAHWYLPADGATHQEGVPRMAIWARTAPLLLALAVAGAVGLGITRGPDQSTLPPSAVVGQTAREQVVLQADLSAVPGDQRDTRLGEVLRVIERRLRAAGLPDATVRPLGGARIGIELPAGQDPAELIAPLTTVGRLDFREQVPQPDGTMRWVVARVRDTDGTERPLTSHYLESASVAAAAAPNQVAVQVEMSAEGRYLLAELTERLLGQQLAIFVDDQLHVALTVRSPIVQGRAQISGHFTPEDARSLAIQLAGGPLPVPVHLADPPKS